MYEFSSKEDRENFKKTEYGKKTNIWLIISVAVFVPIIIFTIFLIFAGTDKISPRALTAIQILTIFSLSAVGYFDGKRDGAIEQFKRSNKK